MYTAGSWAALGVLEITSIILSGSVVGKDFSIDVENVIKSSCMLGSCTLSLMARILSLWIRMYVRGFRV